GDMLAAWAYATAANRTHTVLGKLAAGDLDGAEAVLAALDPGDAGVAASFDQVAATAPTTIAGHLAMIEALQAVLRGWAFHLLAAQLVRSVADGLPHERAAAWGDEALATGLLALAAAQAAHRSATLVLARYEVLGVRGASRVDAVNHPPALRALLAGAERAAR